MTSKIIGIINDHELWITTGGRYGSCADLSCANPRYADLSYANLSYANLRYADLSCADLSCANLSYADLSYANLRYADLSCANLSYADLSCADLSCANLSYANLSYANLSYANLRYADLSRVKNLISTIDFLEAHFERTESGYIAYKTFGEQHTPPEDWKIESGSVISETVNFTRTQECGSGINVAPFEWVQRNYKGTIWKVLIRWEWLCGVCAPYMSDGKIRCERVELMEVVK